MGSPQKRFAWVIGLALALAMLYLIVLNNMIGPVNLFNPTLRILIARAVAARLLRCPCCSVGKHNL